jgi:CBS-domain-containing membrane protein
VERANYLPLKARKAPEGTAIHRLQANVYVAIDSPAIRVMTELRQVSAATIDPEVTLAEATRTMVARGVRLLFVVESGDELLGVITARDTGGERAITLSHDRGEKFAELRVRDLMTPRQEIEVLDLADVLHAEVGHIVATLKACGRQHALVADSDPASGASRICGVFSATQIARQLGIAVQPFEVARTFAEIERALLD